MSEQADAINAYRCEQCNCLTVTINDVEGTTPFMIRCRAATIGCGGRARSMFYRVPPEAGVPMWEWYRPELKDLKDSGERDHVEHGGLLLRKLDAQRRETRYGFRTRRG